MKIPLSWLADFMEINHDVDTYVEMLNQLGFEVEGVESPGKDIHGVIIAKVLETHPHPDADKLKLVDINTGTEEKTIVCGAPNVREGLTVAYAPSGAVLPGGFKLEAKKIRGVISDGMLCSARELELGESHDGIMELSGDLEAGIDAVKALGLDDVIIELSITPNRPDAMSIVGIARELCAAFNQELKLPDPSKFLDGIPIDEELPEPKVEILDTDKCPRFVGRTLSVKVGPSPDWMRNRLMKCDQKSINNVVDVTNYVMLEWGRPLHAFDINVMGSSEIVVRRANKGEKLLLLDETERVLDENDLVIATGDGKARGLAGIMGGMESGIYDSTEKVYLESAYFSPETVSKSSKRLGLRSEASSRFERGVDPNFVLEGSRRACQLIAQVADAKISKIETDVYPEVIEEVEIDLRIDRVEKILGDKLSQEEIVSFLSPLVSEIEQQEGSIKVKAPTFRPDLTREIDLIEEVARRRGLNTFLPTLPNSHSQVGGLNFKQKQLRKLEDAFVGAGLYEAYSLPLEAEEIYFPFGFDSQSIVRTKNALKSDASVLRPLIIPGLLRSAQRNHAKGMADIRFFEIGKVFNHPFDENLQPKEDLHLCVLLSGNVDSRPNGSIRELDVFDARDFLNLVSKVLRIDEFELKDATNVEGFHPTRNNMVYLNGNQVGIIGELISDPKCFVFEVDLDILLQSEQKDSTYVVASNNPFVNFDFALVVDKNVSAQRLENSIKKHGGKEIEHISLFDIYEGSNLGENKKSLAFAIRVRPQDGTFNDNDLSSYRSKILEGVKNDCGAELRS